MKKLTLSLLTIALCCSTLNSQTEIEHKKVISKELLLAIPRIQPKGRLQDKDYQPNFYLIDTIINNWETYLPKLIELIEDTTKYSSSPLTFWSDVRVGDISFIIINNLFRNETWLESTMPGLCWNEILENANNKIPIWEKYDEFIKQNGRKKLKSKVQDLWLKHSENIFWDKKSRCLKIHGTLPEKCS